MKKIILSSISLILVAAITVVAFAATTVASNPKLDEIKNTPYDDGQSFVKGSKGVSKFNDPEGLKAVDKDKNTTWVTAGANSFTQLTFDKMTSINNIHITEKSTNVRLYHVDAWNGLEWVKVFNSDSIEGYYVASIDPIKTTALRLWIDKSWDGGDVEIAEFDASYQRPIEYDREFNHSTYISSTDYAHDWENRVNSEYMDNITDIYMIGMAYVNVRGELVFGIENTSQTFPFARTLKWDDPDVHKYLYSKDMSIDMPDEVGKTCNKGQKGYIEFIKSQYGKKSNPRVSMCLMTLDKNLAPNPADGVAASQLTALQDDTVRAKLVKDLTDFAVAEKLDGIDIDWEYPSDGQKPTFDKLVIELGNSLHKVGKQITAAEFTGQSSKISSPEAIAVLDRINMMAYDQSGSSAHGNHSSFNGATVNDIEKYIAKGVPPEKLCLGLAYYGPSQYKTYYQTLAQQAQDRGEDKIDLGANYLPGAAFNGVYLIRSRTLYAIQRQLGGIFSFRTAIDLNYNDKPELRYASLNAAEIDTIDRYVTYKDGVVTKDGVIKDGVPVPAGE
ncbi:MAG: glycosyl hydrolase family 18 protein [Clostridia bacterium]